MKREDILEILRDNIGYTKIIKDNWKIEVYSNNNIKIDDIYYHKYSITDLETKEQYFYYVDKNFNIIFQSLDSFCGEYYVQNTFIEEKYVLSGFTELYKVKEILNNLYSEENNDIFYDSKNNYIYIAIKYNSTPLYINSLDGHKFQNWELQDLYVYLKFNLDLEFLKLFGKRGKLYNFEYSEEYQHPHLDSSVYSPINAHLFCLGESDLKLNFQNENFLTASEDDLDKWYSLFFTIDNYIQIESYEGIPFIYTKNIVLNGYEPFSNITNVTRETLDKYKNKLIYSNMDKLVLLSSDVSDIKVFKKSNGDLYSNINLKRVDYTVYIDEIDPDYIIFKNKEIEVEIINDHNIDLELDEYFEEDSIQLKEITDISTIIFNLERANEKIQHTKKVPRYRPVIR